MAYIYIIKNKINDLVYVGATKVKPSYRFYQHTKPSVLSKRNYKIQLAFKELGIENFYWELLEEVKNEEMYDKEVYYIKKFNSFHNGYNSTPGGKGGKIIIDKDDVEDVIKMYNETYDMDKIALKYNVCKYTIKRLLIENNVKIKQRTKLKEGYLIRDNSRLFDTKEKQTSLKKDYYNGMTYNELAKKYNVDERTIGRELKRLNVVKRGKGNARKPIQMSLDDFMEEE